MSVDPPQADKALCLIVTLREPTPDSGHMLGGCSSFVFWPDFGECNKHPQTNQAKKDTGAHHLSSPCPAQLKPSGGRVRKQRGREERRRLLASALPPCFYRTTTDCYAESQAVLLLGSCDLRRLRLRSERPNDMLRLREQPFTGIFSRAPKDSHLLFIGAYMRRFHRKDRPLQRREIKNLGPASSF